MLKKAFINVDILIDLIYYSLFMTLHTYLLTQKKVYISLSLSMAKLLTSKKKKGKLYFTILNYTPNYTLYLKLFECTFGTLTITLITFCTPILILPLS